MHTTRPFLPANHVWASGGIVILSGLMISGCTVHQAIPQQPVARTAPQPQGVIAAQPNWFSCQRASDCLVEPGVCSNEAQGVNRAFVAPFRQYREAMSQQVDCKASPAAPVNQAPQCIQHRCVLPAANKAEPAQAKP